MHIIIIVFTYYNNNDWLRHFRPIFLATQYFRQAKSHYDFTKASSLYITLWSCCCFRSCKARPSHVSNLIDPHGWIILGPVSFVVIMLCLFYFLFSLLGYSISSTHLNVKWHLRVLQYILACTWPGPQTSALVKFFISSLIFLSTYRMFDRKFKMTHT